jgi:hypothetical protein
MSSNEVRLADGAIFAFDGRVLEVFGQGDARRIHVATIEKLGRSGAMLEVKISGESDTYFRCEEDDPRRAAFEDLLADVEAARAGGGGS